MKIKLKKAGQIGFLLFALSTIAVSCKKDRVCVCTNTNTNSAGVTTTNQPSTVTFKKIKKSEAISICQKTTEKSNSTTTISGSSYSDSSSSISDCKLK